MKQRRLKKAKDPPLETYRAVTGRPTTCHPSTGLCVAALRLRSGQVRRVARPRPSQPVVPAPDGFPVDPEEVVNSIDDAVEHLGLEVGRLGTVLKRVTDYSLLGSFS